MSLGRCIIAVTSGACRLGGDHVLFICEGAVELRKHAKHSTHVTFLLEAHPDLSKGKVKDVVTVKAHFRIGLMASACEVSAVMFHAFVIASSHSLNCS